MAYFNYNITAGITKLLNNQNPHKAAGPDCIFPMVLWELSSLIAPVMLLRGETG